MLTDNTNEYMTEFNDAIGRALEIIGGKMETYAKKLCPVGTPESTGIANYRGGTLRNSITHEVSKDKRFRVVTVGTNVHYAPYVELGTGKEYEPPPEYMESYGQQGTGRDHWFYQDYNGDWHVGYPVKPRPFLRPAVENHMEEYNGILRTELRNSNR